MLNFEVNAPTSEKLDYQSNPDFGTVQVPVLLWCEMTKDSLPTEIKIQKLEDFPINPFSATLHYGQSIFEGLKAYKNDDEVGIFRLKDSAKRFQNSSEIMSMAPIPEEFFSECVKKYVEVCKDYIPTEDKHALYLRPLMFANDQKIKVASSQSYIFMVMSSIVGDYFAAGNPQTKVLVHEHFVRAFKGGTGEAKTAANYALSLPAVNLARKHGYQQVLYLDAVNKTNFEELGGMNFFWVKDGALCTPKLNGNILHGITRKTVMEIAQILGIKVFEKDMTLAELQTGHADKSISEVFACGTAATIVPLDVIGLMDNNQNITDYNFEKGPIAQKIRDYLYSTHQNKTELSKKYLEII